MWQNVGVFFRQGWNMSCWVEILENLKVSVSDVNTCVANTHWQHSQVLAWRESRRFQVKSLQLTWRESRRFQVRILCNFVIWCQILIEKKQRDREENIVFQEWFKDDKDSSQTRGISEDAEEDSLATNRDSWKVKKRKKKERRLKKTACQIFLLIVFNRQHHHQYFWD